MEKIIADKKREIWIDNVKVVACVLVVLGHFFQSMVKSGIIPRTSIYEWFNVTIYYFHVPLFFICSGYLYQKLTSVADCSTWINNVVKKLIGLGIPYFTFSIITYAMKAVFSSSVNGENRGLADSLFLHPASPYWFLYILFFLFLLIPTFKNKKNAYISLTIAVIMKVICDCLPGYIKLPYIVENIMSFGVWFVIGMVLCELQLVYKLNSKKIINKSVRKASIIGCILFLFVSIIVFRANIAVGIVPFLCGILACSSIILFFASNEIDNRISSFCIKYTLPVFLMHTIFAAGFRSVLLKLNISNPVIHIITGIVISFMGPIVAAYIMKLTKYLEIFLYPNKFIKIKNISR